MDYEDTLVKNEGALKFHFTLLTLAYPNDELPDPPYILIRYIEAEPKGKRLLQQYAPEMIALIKARLGSNRTVVFEPANGEIGNDKEQHRLESYYRSCGFDYLPSSTSKWWMTWPAI